MSNLVDRIRSFGFLLLLLSLSSSQAFAGQFGFNGTFQYLKSSPKFGSAESYSLTPGLRYDEDLCTASAYLPILFQNQDSMARVGQITVPTGSGMAGSGGMSSHMGAGGGTSGILPALGDLNFSGGFRVLNEEHVTPAVSLTTQVKTPTAMSGFGTGEWDFGAGVGLKKTFGSVVSFFDLSYVVTGDPTGKTYRNPLIFGLGAGPMFGDGQLSMLLYYLGSTPVLEGLPGQSQLSVGANYRITEALFLSASLARGFSDSVPETSAAAGFSIYLR
ncbi:transporter [Bdellovibrionota bacterium FG-2]